MIKKKWNLALPVWVSFNTFQYFAFIFFKSYSYNKTYSKKYIYRTPYIKQLFYKITFIILPL